MGILDVRTALVSGAARGIGAAVARRLARDGARVLVADILDDVGQQTAREIAATGAPAVYVHLDVRREEDWRAACVLARALFGGLDILVNNAGIGEGGFLEDTSLEQLHRIASVNVDGVFLGMRECLPLLSTGGKRWAGGAAIVNLSSVAGLIGSPRLHAYGA